MSGTSFERVFLALAALLTLGAYLDAWARVQQPAGQELHDLLVDVVRELAERLPATRGRD